MKLTSKDIIQFNLETNDLLDQLMDTLLYESAGEKDKRAILASRLFASAISEMEDMNLMVNLVEANVAVGNAMMSRLIVAEGRA